MNLNNRLLTIIGLIGVLTALNAFREIKISTDQVSDNADLFKEVYTYGYPIVLMYHTKKSMLSKKGINVNTFDHMTTFPDWRYEDKVKPNVDTFYSSMWMDLSRGPIVVHIPATDRYHIFPAYDAYTNVFSSVGSRNTFTHKEHTYVYTPPFWTGEVPKGMEEIKCPTNMVWIMGRIEGVNTPEDIREVRKLQDEIYAKPLAEWDNPNYKYNHKPAQYYSDLAPREYVKSLSIEDFLTDLSYLMGKNPPTYEDSEILDKMKIIGMRIGKPYTMKHISPVEKEYYKYVPEEVHNSWERKLAQNNKLPWKFYKRDIGKYGTNYEQRAFIAAIGFGANLPADALYPMTNVDDQLRELRGNKEYILHFEKDQIPSVKGFWSLTAYCGEGYLSKNANNKYSVGDRTDLVYNEDGTLDIYLQNTKPDGVPESNWLPTPKHSEFSLMLRMYWPQEKVFLVSYELPSVTEVRPSL